MILSEKCIFGAFLTSPVTKTKMEQSRQQETTQNENETVALVPAQKESLQTSKITS